MWRATPSWWFDTRNALARAGIAGEKVIKA